jgi:O-antigen ligase
MYIQLGVIGLFMLALVLLTFYRRIYKAISTHPSSATLCLAFFTVSIIYNYTEAAFRNNLLWLTVIMVNLVTAVALDAIPAEAERKETITRQLAGRKSIRRQLPHASRLNRI